METSSKNQNSNICQKHNQPLILFDKNQIQPLCFTCVQEKTGMVSYDQFQQQLEEIKTHSNEEFKREQLQLKQLWDSILQYRQNLINAIDKIVQIIMDQIKNIKLSQEQFEQQFELGNQYNTLDQSKNLLKNQEDNHNKVKVFIKQQLQDFKQKFINIDQFNEILSEAAEIKVKANQIQVCEVNQGMNENLGKFQYELIAESGNKQNQYCFDMAFNRDNTNLIVVCFDKIKIYEFINGKIGKELQVLSNHKNYVFYFYVMKQQNCFISGSWDKSMIIWKQDSNGSWAPQQILTDHTSYVNCLLMNKNEDLLISGSNDTTVKFWVEDNEQWSCNQTIDTNNGLSYVFAMSLNELENKLITCGYDAYICVMEIQNDKKWKIQQKIKVDEFGYRLCFTIKDQFVFQPRTKGYLEVYNYDSNSNQFQNIQQVKIQKCNHCYVSFRCKYIKQLNILFVKHGQFLNIFKINENSNYELIQTINYQVQPNLYGMINDDGQYLITWDEGSKEIQVRSMKSKNEQVQ